jgi:hypothetical protein
MAEGPLHTSTACKNVEVARYIHPVLGTRLILRNLRNLLRWNLLQPCFQPIKEHTVAYWLASTPPSSYVRFYQVTATVGFDSLRFWAGQKSGQKSGPKPDEGTILIDRNRAIRSGFWASGSSGTPIKCTYGRNYDKNIDISTYLFTGA